MIGCYTVCNIREVLMDKIKELEEQIKTQAHNVEYHYDRAEKYELENKKLKELSKNSQKDRNDNAELHNLLSRKDEQINAFREGIELLEKKLEIVKNQRDCALELLQVIKPID